LDAAHIKSAFFFFTSVASYALWCTDLALLPRLAAAYPLARAEPGTISAHAFPLGLQTTRFALVTASTVGYWRSSGVVPERNDGTTPDPDFLFATTKAEWILRFLYVG
jgi:hypothetical protein